MTVTRWGLPRILPTLLVVWAYLLPSGYLSGAEVAADSPVEHSHNTDSVSTEPDALGRQLFSAPHSADPVKLEQLRERVPRFAGLDDDYIMRFMHAMGPNYTWYLSDKSMAGKRGVLILAHGFRENGDKQFKRRLSSVASENPTALGLGMSMLTSAHIQLALDDLEAAGAEEIVVVPAVSTRHNTLMRQWNYIFGAQAEPEYATVPQVSSSATIRVVEPLGDHPLVADVLIQYAREISTNPQKEELIIVAHGPMRDSDNQEQLAMMKSLSDAVARSSSYAELHVASLQDDALPEVRRANVAALRDTVSKAKTRGNDVLIVTNLLGTRTVQAQLRRDLRGLDYRFNAKGLAEHENFIRWIDWSVNKNFSQSHQ